MKPASASACLVGKLPEARPVTDPILTMDLAATAMQTCVSAGRKPPRSTELWGELFAVRVPPSRVRGSHPGRVSSPILRLYNPAGGFP
jgi:hypothetical protein